MVDSDRALKELWFGKELCEILFGITPVEQNEDFDQISELGTPVMLTGKKKIKKNTTKVEVEVKTKRETTTKRKKKTTKKTKKNTTKVKVKVKTKRDTTTKRKKKTTKKNKKEPMVREQPGWRKKRLNVAGQFRQRRVHCENIYAPCFPSCRMKVIARFNPVWSRSNSGGFRYFILWCRIKHWQTLGLLGWE